MSQRSQIGPAATDIAKSQHDPYLPGLRLAKTLLVLAPWTIAIPTNFYGICALHVVALGFLVVSVRQGALSRLNGIAASIIVLILSALLLTLIITAAGVDRSILGSGSVLAELDNNITPILWISGASYVGVLPRAQRAEHVRLLMRSMLAFAAFNLMLQIAQLAQVPAAFDYLRFAERVQMNVLATARAPGFFDQSGEVAYFLAIMAALAVTDKKASPLLKTAALTLLLVSGMAVGSKVALFFLLGLILMQGRQIWVFLLALLIGGFAISRFLTQPLDNLLARMTGGDSLLESMSAGRYGEDGLVSGELSRILADHPLGLGLGSQPAGLIEVAYDSEILQAVVFLGVLGLFYVAALVSLLISGAWLSGQRRRAFSLLLAFGTAAQVMSASSANSSAAFFWLAFTMVCLLKNCEDDSSAVAVHSQHRHPRLHRGQSSKIIGYSCLLASVNTLFEPKRRRQDPVLLTQSRNDQAQTCSVIVAPSRPS